LACSYAIVGIAAYPSCSEAAETSEVLPLIDTMVHSLPAGLVASRVEFSGGEVEVFLKLLDADSLSTSKLVALHHIASSIAEHSSFQQDNIRFLSRYPAFIAAVREACASSDAFIFMVAVFVLRQLGLPCPNYREAKTAAIDYSLVPQWNLNQVVQWLKLTSYGRYSPEFRSNVISGRLLLTLVDADLVGMGIANAMHRRGILFHIDDLRAAGAHGGSGGSSSSSAVASLSSSMSSSTDDSGYDVFISYRRAGGADFAHLLKMQLKAAGLKVFLDVENLGKGKFEDELRTSLMRAKNVILVWTKGCMDRFLGQEDPSVADFVRIEYALAIGMRKNMVPVYKEDFVFPTLQELPDDVKPVLGFNAIKWVAEYVGPSFDRIKSSLIS
jgi:hypothetical protein